MTTEKKQRIVYIVAGIDRSLAFEWIEKELDKDKFELSFILVGRTESRLRDYLVEKKIRVYPVRYHGKKDALSTLKAMYRILRKESPQMVHCHLFEAALFGLFVSKLIGIKKRIYTRHHATSNWFFNKKMVKWDKLINRMATDVVAISHNVYNVLIEKEKVKVSKVHFIHHGFDLASFEHPDEDLVEMLRTKYLSDRSSSPVVGIISRYLELKGIEYTIRAFAKFSMEYPNAKLIICNAKGPYQNKISEELKKLKQTSYIEIPFEPEIVPMYNLFDIFVHVPIEETVEAFGQIYVEALASSVPSIFTLSGVAKEFIVPDENAVVVGYKDSNAIYQGMKKIWEDESFKNQLITKGKESTGRFGLRDFILKLEKLYA